MFRTVALPLAVLALAACTRAASPLGSISSAQPFDLNGSSVPVAGVPAWPVTAGDVVATHSAPATIEFLDGSRVILAEDSKASIAAKAGKSVLRFPQGPGEYSLAAHPSLSIFVRDKQTAVKSTNGRFVPACAGGGGGDNHKPPDHHPPQPPKPPSPSPDVVSEHSNPASRDSR
ncbi:MAG: hypothetical protein WBL65_00285 [Bryobacteraceae bacterium]